MNLLEKAKVGDIVKTVDSTAKYYVCKSEDGYHPYICKNTYCGKNRFIGYSFSQPSYKERLEVAKIFKEKGVHVNIDTDKTWILYALGSLLVWSL